MRFAFLALAAVLASAPPALAQMTGPPQPLPPEALTDHADATKAGWLRAHTVIDGPVTGGLSFELPDSFYRSQLILLGESHGVAAPQVLDFELLKHLNARIGLTAYLAEVDPVQGDQLNRYLDTGDEALLARVFDHWEAIGAQWANTAFEDKVRAIRALNQTLPTERRVSFVGVDAIQDWALTADWLRRHGASTIDLATGTHAERATRALAALPATQSPVTARLRDVLESLAAGQDRETVIFAAYEHAVRSGELAGKPAYGLWGLFHVMQGHVNGAEPFAAMVRASDLPAATSITSLVTLSLDSAVHIPVPLPTGTMRMRLEDFNIDGPFVMAPGAATLRAASAPERITLFDVTAAGTPVVGTDFLAFRTSVGQDFTLDPSATTPGSYAQYVGVFRNSDWAPARKTEAVSPP